MENLIHHENFSCVKINKTFNTYFMAFLATNQKLFSNRSICIFLKPDAENGTKYFLEGKKNCLKNL